MTKNPTWLPVVAGYLINESGQILLQQRPQGRHHGGLWEFPGGKVEEGETPREALARELLEELALSVLPDAMQPAGFAEEGSGPNIVLILYKVDGMTAAPDAQDGQQWRWLDHDEVSRLPLAPMDRALFAQLPR